MSLITFQKVTEKDLVTYMNIENSAVVPKIYPWVVSMEEAKERINDEYPTLFIKKDGDIVGNVRYSLSGPDNAYIKAISIKPEFQGQGIATEAMRHLIEGELKNVQRIDLVTHPENEKAVAMYSKLGFIIESRKENYYGDGEPRIVMARTQNV